MTAVIKSLYGQVQILQQSLEQAQTILQES